MKKPIQYILMILAALLLIYLSLDIQKLDAFTAGQTEVAEDAAAYAERFWQTEIPSSIDDALELDRFLQLIGTDPQQAYTYGHQLGISQTHYFIVKGSGSITSVDDEYLLVNTGGSYPVQIATSFIFGNAVRDGSGKVNIDDFLNMTEFNNVSIAINRIVKDSVVTKLKAVAVPGTEISFAGAIEISEDDIRVDAIRIIPVSFSTENGTLNE